MKDTPLKNRHFVAKNGRLRIQPFHQLLIFERNWSIHDHKIMISVLMSNYSKLFNDRSRTAKDKNEDSTRAKRAYTQEVYMRRWIWTRTKIAVKNEIPYATILSNRSTLDSTVFLNSISKIKYDKAVRKVSQIAGNLLIGNFFLQSNLIHNWRCIDIKSRAKEETPVIAVKNVKRW